MWIFYLIFSKNRKYLIFRKEKIIPKVSNQKLRFFFFLVAYLVDKTSCKRFLNSLKNHARFKFFFCFPYKLHYSAIFQPTCRKWRSGSSFGLPVSESAQFKKQIWIFNAIFEKKNSLNTSHALCRNFFDFRFL